MFRIFKKIKQTLREFSSDYPFKIVEILGDPNNKNTRIAYQVNGKSTVVTDNPEKLVDELMYLKSFSKKDAELVYGLAVAERMSPAFRVIAILFEEDAVKFDIEDLLLCCTYLLTPEEILNSRDLIKHFSDEDIIKIYFQCLKNNEQAEKIFKKKFSKAKMKQHIGLIKETDEK